MESQPKRCSWVNAGNALMREYHDREWGVPAHDDRTHFEFLVLEAAQAGLSWSIVLNKREGYRRAFSGFDPEKVARYTKARIEKLTVDPTIIRNREGEAQTVEAIEAGFGSKPQVSVGSLRDRADRTRDSILRRPRCVRELTDRFQCYPRATRSTS